MNIVGCGGLAKQIEDVIKSFNTYSISCKGSVETIDSCVIGFAALNDLEERQVQYNCLVAQGKKIGTIISPFAIVSQDAHILDGSVVLHRAFVGPSVLLRWNVLVATGAIVEHDTEVGPHSIILTGAIVNGNCNIGKRCMIGSGAIIINDINICDDVKIGAGAVVTKDITKSGTYVGCPAKKVTDG